MAEVPSNHEEGPLWHRLHSPQDNDDTTNEAEDDSRLLPRRRSTAVDYENYHNNRSQSVTTAKRRRKCDSVDHNPSYQCRTAVSFSSHNSTNVSSNSSSQSSPSPYLFHFLVLVLLTFAQYADACSSRSTPKPRPANHSAMRPNITFQTYACPPAYAAWYCLNGATCFTVKIADSILYNCECADGYMGQRCEFKDLDGTYLPTRERLLMGMGLLGKSGSQIGPAFLAVLLIIVAAVIVSLIVTKTRTKAKKARILRQQQQQQSDISHIDCGMAPQFASSHYHHRNSLPVMSGSRCSTSSQTTTADLSVLGQSISYSLSQQRYPYLGDCYQGVELRSIHRNDSNGSMMVSSRIPAKNLNYTT